jgi:hypothetical protein
VSSNIKNKITRNAMKHSAFKLFTKAAFYAPETGQWSDLNQFLKDARESAIAAGFTRQWIGPDWEVWATCPSDGDCRTLDTGENIETTEIWQLLAALLALPQGDSQSLAQKLMEAAAKQIQPTLNYEMLTGPFAGSIVADGTKILDVPWGQLPDDLKSAAIEWADSQRLAMSQAGLIEAWECSWESTPTAKAVTLRSMSEWERSQ